MTPIAARVTQPTPEQVRAARLAVNLTQGEAALLVSSPQGRPERSWQGYEVPVGKPSHRAISLATWELFLLLTEQHPTHQLALRAAPTQ